MQRKLEVILVRHSEPIRTQNNMNARLMRTGLMFEELSKNGNLDRVVWYTARFDHFNKKPHAEPYYTETKTNMIKLISTPGYKNNKSIMRIIDDFIFGVKVAFEILRTPKQRQLVTIASYPTIFACLFSLVSTKIKRGSFILEVRDKWPDVFSDVLKPNFVTTILISSAKLCLKILLNNADFITVPSEGYKRWLAESYSPKNKNIQISPLPYISENEYEAQSDIALNKKESSKYFLAVFFGTLGNMFDFETMIDSIISINSTKALEKPIHLHIYGNGDNAERLKQKYSNNSEIIFQGYKDLTKLARAASEATVALAPYKGISNFEGHFPNKLAEYISLGIPVVHSVPGAAQYFTKIHHCGEYYAPGDNEKFKSAIIKVLSNPSNYKFNAKEIYNTEFSPKKCFSPIIGFITRNSRYTSH